jgi:hypothetical protein
MTSRPSGEVQHRALAFGYQERRLVLLGMMQGMNEIAPVDVEQLCRGAVHRVLQLKQGWLQSRNLGLT